MATTGMGVTIKIRLPVYMRIGEDGTEHRVGTIEGEPGELAGGKLTGLLLEMAKAVKEISDGG
jgi:hypothetical protein